MPEFEGSSQAMASGVGITVHLLQLLDDLAYINRNIQEEEKRNEYYKQVYNQLSNDEAMLRLNEEILNEEIPEEFEDFMCELNTTMKTSNILFMDAIKVMMKFIISEDPELLENAASTIDEGSKMLIKAAELNQILKDYLEQQNFQTTTQEE